MIELGRHNTTDINNRICPLCKNGVEDEYHLIILCSSLNNIRNKMLANILSLFLSFHVLTDENKFLYFFQCEECVDNLLTMSVHDDGYYRNSPCWQSFDYERTWRWLLQKYAVLTIFWLCAYMMMVITEIRRFDNLLTRSVHDDGYYRTCTLLVKRLSTRRISVITIIRYTPSQKIVKTAYFCNNHHHVRS
jgi:hypothetical protein